jgi:arcC: carbamate kinase
MTCKMRCARKCSTAISTRVSPPCSPRSRLRQTTRPLPTRSSRLVRGWARPRPRSWRPTAATSSSTTRSSASVAWLPRPSPWTSSSSTPSSRSSSPTTWWSPAAVAVFPSPRPRATTLRALPPSSIRTLRPRSSPSSSTPMPWLSWRPWRRLPLALAPTTSSGSTRWPRLT